MATIEGALKAVDVIKIEGLKRGRPVYALEGIDFGIIRDVIINADKFWWVGSSLKPYATVIRNLMRVIFLQSRVSNLEENIHTVFIFCVILEKNLAP